MKEKLLQKDYEFPENELQELCYEYAFIFDIGDGENGRWQKYMETIIEVDGRYFQINWSQGLTEYQENSYPNQPYEVFKHTKEVTTTKTWYDTNKD